ncbi:MAG: hypothetical protein WC714_10910 [Candidatus Obscuribacterales bacterium]|jgi:hypothetical protein
MNLVIKITLLLFVCFLSYCCGSSCQAKPNVTAWLLEQNEEDFGDCHIYLCHDGVKVISKKLDCELLCKAPDWKVHCYSKGQKSEWIGDLSQFSGLVMANPFAQPDVTKSLATKAVGSGDLNGLKYTKYRTQFSAKDLIYTADDLDVDPKVAEFMARMYVVPLTKKIPLSRITDKGQGRKLAKRKQVTLSNSSASDLRGGVVTKLVTKSWKPIRYNSADYVAPKGYKRMKDIIQVSYSANRKAEVDSMLDQIGFKSKPKP